MDNGNSKQICGGESRAEDDEAAIISRADDKVEWIANGYLSVEHMKM